MPEFVAVTSRLSSLFNQPLIVSLLQPVGKNQADYKAYKTSVNLKITEQRNENGEKEMRFEVSKKDDFEFLFAEILNNEKYQELAREHDLIVDFDAFPRTIIQKLLCKNIANQAESEGGPHSFTDNKATEITLILDADKTTCLFELFSKTPISKGRIFSLKLSAVRGDQLTAHLLRICSNQAAKLVDFNEISQEVEKLRETCGQLRAENERLKQIEEDHKANLERIEELEDELELVKEERSNVRELVEEKEEEIQHLQQDLEDVKKENEDVADELEIVVSMLREEQGKVDKLQSDKESLRKENAELRKDVEKSKHVVKKYLNTKSTENGQQSVDLRKLKELENDLKEKDGMIEKLTETIGLLRTELEDEKLKLSEVSQDLDQVRKSNLEINGKLQMYRSNRAATMTPGSNTYLSPLLMPNLATTSAPSTSASPFGMRPATTPGYKEVFPRISPFYNSPMTTTALGSRTPGHSNQTSPYNNSMPNYPPTTPSAFRNLTNLTNDTTTTTVTTPGGLTITGRNNV